MSGQRVKGAINHIDLSENEQPGDEHTHRHTVEQFIYVRREKNDTRTQILKVP